MHTRPIPSDSYDTALPLDWVDSFERLTHFHAAGQFVWLYDEKAKIFGRPYPLTPQARQSLKRYNHKAGTNYPTD